MWKVWLQRLFNNNPVLFNSAEYFGKVGKAFQVWLAALLVLFGLVTIGCAVIVLSALNSWF